MHFSSDHGCELTDLFAHQSPDALTDSFAVADEGDVPGGVTLLVGHGQDAHTAFTEAAVYKLLDIQVVNVVANLLSF